MQPHTLIDPDLLASLRHQAVRDLAWCCFSSPLLAALPKSDARILPLPHGNHEINQWLTQLDQYPEPLLQSLAQAKSTRLGIYYEHLWRFYFSHHPQWQLLAQNMPVYKDKLTLGAFDFLCRCGDEYWHIETAVKFYLCDTDDPQQASDWHHWLGPNSNDRLDLKLARLTEHQLPLHQSAEGLALLAKTFPQAKHWHTGLCLQGYLFSPAPPKLSSSDLAQSIPSEHFLRPSHSHPSQGSGFWWYLRDFLALISDRHTAIDQHTDADIHWVILEYHQWFSPIELRDEASLQSPLRLSERISQHLLQTQRPLMLAAVKKYDAGDKPTKIVWREQLRAFVVPNEWPHQQTKP
uniref:DUF1853 family protein n=1 Tax=Cellvibrio fontiphilus TaxID=1815559 RepID=UPI002B4C0E11|nr:DUF1853 family protein [Cellvibrio fontiphilus]